MHEKLVEALEKYKQELQSGVVFLYSQGNNEKAAESFKRWNERFKNFLYSFDINELKSYESATKSYGIRGAYESQYNYFMTHKGRKINAYIETLMEYIKQGKYIFAVTKVEPAPLNCDPKPVQKRSEEMANAEHELPVEILESITRFKADYPESTKTAFIMMKFGTTKAHWDIVEAIKKALSSVNIIGIRADDKQYHDDLFHNILTYMYGCNFGIAVFERIEADEFNPNVSLEVGYLLALKKPVCLIKDKTLKTLHTDLVGKLYKVFDPHEPENTIATSLLQWLRDKSLI